MTARAALEVGGTHVQACRVDPRTWTVVPGSTHRAPLSGGGSADAILTAMAACARALGSLAADTLAVAMPGPFDYAAGIGRFRDVGKFDALAGVDVRAGLLGRLTPPPREITFVNDAGAFALGEWLSGAARGYQRAVAITLGTGVGSGFIDAGRLVSAGPRVPPGGHVHRLRARGQPLEASVSRRALIAAYRARVPAAGKDIDVSDIAARAAAGDEAASVLFGESFHLLGTVIGPWLTRFGAEVLVVGGGLARARPLIAGPLGAGLAAAGSAVPVAWSGDTGAAAAIGAAGYAATLAKDHPK
jgi:glucokinase